MRAKDVELAAARQGAGGGGGGGGAAAELEATRQLLTEVCVCGGGGVLEG